MPDVDGTDVCVVAVVVVVVVVVAAVEAAVVVLAGMPVAVTAVSVFAFSSFLQPARSIATHANTARAMPRGFFFNRLFLRTWCFSGSGMQTASACEAL